MAVIPTDLSSCVALIACLCVAVAGVPAPTLRRLPLTTDRKLEDFRYLVEVFLESNP
jgi:hypothetical protein